MKVWVTRGSLTRIAQLGAGGGLFASLPGASRQAHSSLSFSVSGSVPGGAVAGSCAVAKVPRELQGIRPPPVPAPRAAAPGGALGRDPGHLSAKREE